MVSPTIMDSSGENSSELTIGLRESYNFSTEKVVVDEKALNAGSHHGSTYYEHLKFVNAIQNNSNIAEVSVRDGLMSVAIGQAAEMSIKEKRLVLLSEIL